RLLAPPTPAGATPAVAAAAAPTSTQVASASSVLPAAGGTTSTAATSTTSTTATVTRGGQGFANIGCSACHTRSLTSRRASTPALSNKTFQPLPALALPYIH